jgi:hypothetical protein
MVFGHVLMKNVIINLLTKKFNKNFKITFTYFEMPNENVMYIHMKEGSCSIVCLFVALRSSNCSILSSTLGESPLMSRGCIELVSQCFNLRWRSYRILNNFLFTENSIKSTKKLYNGVF